MTKVTPALYILMRNDMASMTPGRAMAQASHASNAFVDAYTSRPLNDQIDDDDIVLRDAFGDWVNATPQGCGTAIVLAVNEFEMRQTVEFARNFGFEQVGIFVDPDYVIKDGDTYHSLSIDTCAWVFVPDKDDPKAKLVLGNYPLHP